MGLVTWTAVFTLPGLRDSSDEVAQSINGLVGASLQKKLHPQLASRGWNFGDAFAEDHGWHSEAAIFDDGKTIGVSLVTCPELDEAAPDGSALDDRWRIVVGLDLGMFSKTKTRRLQILTRLASDTETACRQLGAQSFVWEVGGSHA
jgi:hypothetical protein